MEKKNLKEQTTTSEEAMLFASDSKEDQIADLKEDIRSIKALIQAKQDQIPDVKDQQITNLREELNSLLNLVKSGQEEKSRQALFETAIGDVRELKTMIKNSILTPAPIAEANRHSCPCTTEQDGGCSSCQCVSSKCCCFEIIMTHFRVVHMQSVEPLDTNAAPTDELELRFFASIDQINNIGAIIPNPTGYVTGRKGLLEPIGIWVPVYRNIGSKCLSKGTKESVTIELIITEVETPLESVVFNRDEYGSASESFILDCCYNSYPPIIITVALTGGGIDVAPGVIEAKFSINKKC